VGEQPERRLGGHHPDRAWRRAGLRSGCGPPSLAARTNSYTIGMIGNPSPSPASDADSSEAASPQVWGRGVGWLALLQPSLADQPPIPLRQNSSVRPLRKTWWRARGRRRRVLRQGSEGSGAVQPGAGANAGPGQPGPAVDCPTTSSPAWLRCRTPASRPRRPRPPSP
jgi:hypothetical protein